MDSNAILINKVESRAARIEQLVEMEHVLNHLANMGRCFEWQVWGLFLFLINDYMSLYHMFHLFSFVTYTRSDMQAHSENKIDNI